MIIPSGFKYKDVFIKGRPQHEEWDDFKLKHPPMPASKWAKIYAPFDALKGFDEEIESQEEVYIQKPLLSEEQKDELDRKLKILSYLTRNGKEARKNHVMAEVKYFEHRDASPVSASPEGIDSELGKIIKTAGQVWKVDPIVSHTIKIDRKIIGLKNILGIESSVFNEDPDSFSRQLLYTTTFGGIFYSFFITILTAANSLRVSNDIASFCTFIGGFFSELWENASLLASATWSLH